MSEKTFATPVGDYRAFLVRLWRNDPETPWRASAKDTQTGEQHYFASPENLFRFLHKETNIPPENEV